MSHVGFSNSYVGDNNSYVGDNNSYVGKIGRTQKIISPT